VRTSWSHYRRFATGHAVRQGFPGEARQQEPRVANPAWGHERRRQLAGELLVRADGTVAKVWSLREPKLIPAFAPFNEAILEAVRQWEYEPWTVDGRAAPFCVTVAMSIDL
jgi:hypothetical protein